MSLILNAGTRALHLVVMDTTHEAWVDSPMCGDVETPPAARQVVERQVQRLHSARVRLAASLLQPAAAPVAARHWFEPCPARRGAVRAGCAPR